MIALLSMVLAALAAGAQGSPATANQGEDGPIVSLSTRSCGFRRAREIELATLIRDYSRLRGQCVAVRGWNQGRTIYRSLADARADPSLGTGNRSVGIGIYGDSAALASLSSEPRRVMAAGIVGACEVMWGAHGYCHDVLEGGFLILGEIRAQP